MQQVSPTTARSVRLQPHTCSVSLKARPELVLMACISSCGDTWPLKERGLLILRINSATAGAVGIGEAHRARGRAIGLHTCLDEGVADALGVGCCEEKVPKQAHAVQCLLATTC